MPLLLELKAEDNFGKIRSRVLKKLLSNKIDKKFLFLEAFSVQLIKLDNKNRHV